MSPTTVVSKLVVLFPGFDKKEHHDARGPNDDDQCGDRSRDDGRQHGDLLRDVVALVVRAKDRTVDLLRQAGAKGSQVGDQKAIALHVSW